MRGLVIPSEVEEPRVITEKQIRGILRKLIYFEAYPDPTTAIAREKQVKHWRREKKDALIAKRNPEWRDLFDQMYALQPIGGVR